MLVRPATILSFLPALSAQAFVDSFDYPSGEVVPGWTQQRGTWRVQDGRLLATSGATWAYITRDGLRTWSCVLEATMTCVGPGVQFGGLVARHPGGDQDAGLLLTKIQNNGGTNFDRLYAYERGVPLGTYFADIPGGAALARCRMFALGGEFWMEIDANLDGVFELALPPRPITQVQNPGLVGLGGYGDTEIDDFEYFDAVLLPAFRQAHPRIGGSYWLRLVAPVAGEPWIAALALANTGVRLPDGRGIPLSLDPLLEASLGVASALGLVGMTDGSGQATFTVRVPAVPNLVGLNVFASAFTIDVARPFAVGHISNEQHFQVRP